MANASKIKNDKKKVNLAPALIQGINNSSARGVGKLHRRYLSIV
jgi:hypothetical protein